MAKPSPEERARRRASMEQLGEIRGGPPALASDASDLEQAKHLLSWCRAERIAVGHVVVGKVSIQVHDLGMPGARTDLRPPSSTDSRALYEEYGGAALRKMRTEVEEYYEDDDDDEAPDPPPKGRRR